jgi:xylan 1,4-beta-xylosidase
MSLSTNRFLRIDPVTGLISADSPGQKSGGSDGDRFDWSSTPPDSPP